MESVKIHNAIPDVNTLDVETQRHSLENIRKQISACNDSAERQRLKNEEQNLMKQIRIMLSNEEDKNSKFILKAQEAKSKIRLQNREVKNAKRNELIALEEQHKLRLYESE
jgi:hypothetical protein